MHFRSEAGRGLMGTFWQRHQPVSLMHADAVLLTLKIGTVHISNPRGSIVVFLSCKPWRTECSCVTYVLHARLTYDSEQKCTGPITTRNQSHVSWRSIPRHFIRSFLLVQFHTCAFLNRENLLTVRGFRSAHDADTELQCRGAFISGTLHHAARHSMLCIV